MLLDQLITPIKLHTNYTQLPQPRDNAKEFDEIGLGMADNIDNEP